MAARIRPERRTRLDLIITAVIVVVVLVTGVALWLTSPVRGTDSTVAETTPEAPILGDGPFTLTELWRAPSPVTTLPAVAQSTVLTGEGGTVIGRAVTTGEELWHYRRSEELCALLAAWPGSENLALAAYRNSRGCSEITGLDAATGERRGNRTSDADAEIELSYGTGQVLAVGPWRLETWGANLVRGIEYGRVDAPVNPGVFPNRDNCRIFSAVSGDDRVAVLERCEADRGYRLSVFSTDFDSEEQLEEWGSEPITETSTGAPPVVLGVNRTSVTVYDGGADSTAPDATPTIRVFSPEIVQRAGRAVAGSAEPPADSRPINSQRVITYFTGDATVVINADTGDPVFQISEAIGPGELGTGLLVPVPGAVSVRDPANGKEIRRIPVDRGGYTGVVSLRVIGDVVVEQRGDEVVALGPSKD